MQVSSRFTSPCEERRLLAYVFRTDFAVVEMTPSWDFSFSYIWSYSCLTYPCKYKNHPYVIIILKLNNNISNLQYVCLDVIQKFFI